MKGRPESKHVDQRDMIYERQETILLRWAVFGQGTQSDCIANWCTSPWKQEVAGGEEARWLGSVLVFSIFLLTPELLMLSLL